MFYDFTYERYAVIGAMKDHHVDALFLGKLATYATRGDVPWQAISGNFPFFLLYSITCSNRSVFTPHIQAPRR